MPRPKKADTVKTAENAGNPAAENATIAENATVQAPKKRGRPPKDPALKAEFEEKKKDAKFANDPQAILNFFYEKVKKSAHQNNELHPAWRVLR